MKKIIFILLCLTVISMGEVNAQDAGSAFYGTLYFDMDGDMLLFVTDVHKDCNDDNEYELSSRLKSYLRARYPDYFKRGAGVGGTFSSITAVADIHFQRGVTPQRAYASAQKERTDDISDFRRRLGRYQDVIVVPIRKRDFDFYQDCN